MRRQDAKTDMWMLEGRKYQDTVPVTTRRRGGGGVRCLPSSTAVLTVPAVEQPYDQSMMPPPSRSSAQTHFALADLMEAAKKQVTLDLLVKDHLQRLVQSTPAPPASAFVAAALTPRQVESRSYHHGYLSSPELPSQPLIPRASLQLHSPPHASRPTTRTTTTIQDDLLLKALQERRISSAASVLTLQNFQDHLRQHRQRQEQGLQLLLQQQTLSPAYLPPPPSLPEPAATHADLTRMIHEKRVTEGLAADALLLEKESKSLLVGGSDQYRFQQEVMLRENHATTIATASTRSSSPRVAVASSSSSRNDREKETARDEPATPGTSKMMKIGLLEDDETGVDALHRNKLSFPEKIYFMLEEVERQGRGDIVSFVSEGTAFMIHKPRQFEDDIMPLFFASRRMSSFQRQLNIYGFTRMNQEPWKGAYKHVFFVRGEKASLSKIKRCIDAKKERGGKLCWHKETASSMGV